MATKNKTAVSVPVNVARFASPPVKSGSMLQARTTGDMIEAISFDWGSRWTVFFKAVIYSSVGGSARFIIAPDESNYIMLSLTGIKVQQGGASTTFDGLTEYDVLHDYAIVYDGEFIRCYRDMAPVSAAAFTTDPYSGAKDYTILNRAAGDRVCNMDVAYIQFYADRAFSPEEIVAHYRSNPEDTENLVLSLRLQEGSGAVATNTAPGGVDGVIAGCSWGTFDTPHSKVTYEGAGI